MPWWRSPGVPAAVSATDGAGLADVVRFRPERMIATVVVFLVSLALLHYRATPTVAPDEAGVYAIAQYLVGRPFIDMSAAPFYSPLAAIFYAPALALFDFDGTLTTCETFPRFVRQTGINARQRVARFLSRGGIDAVLAEITLVEGAHGKRLYFSELLKQVTLDAGSARTVLAQAGREIDSDYELATLLIDVARAAPLDDAAVGGNRVGVASAERDDRASRSSASASPMARFAARSSCRITYPIAGSRCKRARSSRGRAAGSSSRATRRSRRTPTC